MSRDSSGYNYSTLFDLQLLAYSTLFDLPRAQSTCCSSELNGPAARESSALSGPELWLIALAARNRAAILRTEHLTLHSLVPRHELGALFLSSCSIPDSD